MIFARTALAGLAATALLGAATVGVSSSVSATVPDLEAHLHASTGHPDAHGHADYRDGSGEHRLRLTLRGITELAGHRVVVRVDGTRVGRATVSADGVAHLRRHHGVPDCSASDHIRVRTPGGTLVATGTLRHDTHDHHGGHHHDGHHHDGHHHDGHH